MTRCMLLEPLLGGQRGGTHVIGGATWDKFGILPDDFRNARRRRVQFDDVDNAWQGFVERPFGGRLFWTPSGDLDSWFHVRLADSCSLAFAPDSFVVETVD